MINDMPSKVYDKLTYPFQTSTVHENLILMKSQLIIISKGPIKNKPTWILIMTELAIETLSEAYLA